MLAEPAVQLRLLGLAEVDGELARVTHAAKSLPEHAKIQALMSHRQEAADVLTAATTAADDLAVAAERAEQDLAPVRERLARDQRLVSDGSVTDAKALQGLLQEIEHLKVRIAKLEDVQLEAMSAAEEAVETRDQLAARKAEVEDQLRELVRTRDAQVAVLKEEAQALVAKRKPIASSLPEALMRLYEKLRSSTGMGAARLVQGKCGGCQLPITVSDLAELRKAPANQVLRCPECDRILVRTKDS